MKTTLIIVVLAMAACFATQSQSAESATERQSRIDREVNALLGELRASSCRFNRNGTWYDGADASQHLNKKYDHLRSRLASTEQFIEKGASSSSMSGKAYLVQCGEAKAVTSGAWLSDKLKSLRKSGRIEKEQEAFAEEREREEEEERERENRE